MTAITNELRLEFGFGRALYLVHPASNCLERVSGLGPKRGTCRVRPQLRGIVHLSAPEASFKYRSRRKSISGATGYMGYKTDRQHG